MTKPTLQLVDSPQRRTSNRGQRFDPDPYTTDELVTLLRTFRQPWLPGHTAWLAAEQRYAMGIVLWRSGVRCSELLDLEERDLHRDDRAITVRHGKGGKRRTVMMDEWAWRELDGWLELRQEIPFGKLFCVLRAPSTGGPITTSQIRWMMGEARKRSGLRRRVHCHAFRHTHALNLFRANVSLLAIMLQLGHSRLNTTQLYLRSMGADVVLREIADLPAPMISFSMALAASTSRLAVAA